jgi:hypothetical protein
MMPRLRQIALVADDLAAAEPRLTEPLDLSR